MERCSDGLPILKDLWGGGGVEGSPAAPSPQGRKSER